MYALTGGYFSCHVLFLSVMLKKGPFDAILPCSNDSIRGIIRHYENGKDLRTHLQRKTLHMFVHQQILEH